MGFFKEFLGGFAEGYLEERGIEGTIEDLGDVASGVKKFFSSDEDSSGFNQDVWNEMINRVNQHLERDEYAEAENVLIDYYNDYENGEADIFYYRNRSLISICYYENLNADSEQVAEIEKEIREFLKEMKAMSNGDKDLLADYQGLKDRFETEKKNKKEFNAYMDRWNNLVNRIDNLNEAHEYDLALQELDNHYKNYEDEKDFYYFDNKCKILADKFLNQDIKSDRERLEAQKKISKEFAICVNEMKKKESEDNKATRKEYESALDFMNDKNKVLKTVILTNEGKYDEAKAYIESSFPNKGYDYYQQMSRIESLRLQDAVKKQLPKETVKKILDDAKFNMNLAIEIQEDAKEKELIKSNVLPRIKEGELYIESDNNNSNSKSQRTSAVSVNSKEQEYLDEYKICIENDGVISDRERRLLNRLRDSLGISEERAMELEAQCNPSILSNEEKEYLEEFKACMEDGVISDRERRLLDRLAKSLNISPERIVQLENTSL